MNRSNVERTFSESCAVLEAKGYTLVRSRGTGMGASRLYANKRFAVEIVNDRDMFLAGIAPVSMPDDYRFSLDWWALCLGLRLVQADDRERVHTSNEKSLIVGEDLAALKGTLAALETLDDEEVVRILACVERRDEEYWRSIGVWPRPRPGDVMRGARGG